MYSISVVLTFQGRRGDLEKKIMSTKCLREETMEKIWETLVLSQTSNNVLSGLQHTSEWDA